MMYEHVSPQEEANQEMGEFLQKYGSEILLKSVAYNFGRIKESASIYPSLAKILEALSEIEP